MKARRLALVLLIVLLVVVGEVLAAGAWVLWVREEHFSDPKGGQWGAQTRSWNVLAASSTEPECRRKLRERIERVTNPDFPPKDVKVLYKVIGDTVRFLFYPKDGSPTDTMIAAQDLHYICLPDTVDPREPRGRN